MKWAPRDYQPARILTFTPEPSHSFSLIFALPFPAIPAPNCVPFKCSSYVKKFRASMETKLELISWLGVVSRFPDLRR